MMWSGVKNMIKLPSLRNLPARLLIFGICLAPQLALAQDGRIAQFTPGGLRLRQADTGAFPEQIEDMPDVTAELKVIHRRSQLMITKKNVIRTAIADQRVVDIVQFSPNELAFIGQSLGSTNVTFWFEDDPRPLIYLVEVIRDPSIENQQRIDYGKLEQRLADFFPNSKVYLIPMSRKIIVKGQARSPEEASRILQIVRGEVLNQNGALGNPLLGNGGFGVGGAGGLGGLNNAAGLNPFDLASNLVVDMLTVPGENQVVLRVRIAELKRSMLRQLGVNFNLLLNN